MIGFGIDQTQAEYVAEIKLRNINKEYILCLLYTSESPGGLRRFGGPMASKKNDYGNDSISSLKGADRVRKRPGVIFGSDGLDGCEHAVFEILSNSIDEAREGHGRVITQMCIRDSFRLGGVSFRL